MNVASSVGKDTHRMQCRCTYQQSRTCGGGGPIIPSHVSARFSSAPPDSHDFETRCNLRATGTCSIPPPSLRRHCPLRNSLRRLLAGIAIYILSDLLRRYARFGVESSAVSSHPCVGDMALSSSPNLSTNVEPRTASRPYPHQYTK
jgi:hypothetical protein